MSGDSFAYAKALSSLEERRAALPMVALGANGGVLTMRIRRLLGYNESPAVPRLAAISLLAIVFAATGLCVRIKAARTRPARMRRPPIRQQPDGEISEVAERGCGVDCHAARAQGFSGAECGRRTRPVHELNSGRPPQSHRRALRRIQLKPNTTAGFSTRTTISPMGAAAGWKTDRGRIYIQFGAPDEVNSHPQKGSTHPWETWRYHSVMNDKKVHMSFDRTFLDTCGCGEYKLQSSARN